MECNQESCYLLNQNLKKIIGRRITDFAPLSSHSHIISSLEKFENNALALHEGGNDAWSPGPSETDGLKSHRILHPIEWVLHKPDGTIIEAQVYLNLVNLGDTAIIQVMVRDITEINELHRRESKAIYQIEENLVQLAAINDQIRNPLAIISTYSEMQGGEYDQQIQDQVHRIDLLIDTIDQGFIKTDKVRIFLHKHYKVEQIRD